MAASEWQQSLQQQPYPSSYQVGVVGLVFWESPESPCVEDEKHFVLSVWHPGEEMNLGL